MVELMSQTDHEILAFWAIECAERVLPYFEDIYPDDPRPRQAIETPQEWSRHLRPAGDLPSHRSR